MMNNKTLSLTLAALLMAGAAPLVTGCSSAPVAHEVADRVATPAWLIERQIPAGPFALTAHERMHKRHAPANIYIEGDGDPLARFGNPTPLNPVALHMASKDKAQNVAHLARPCQYSGMQDQTAECASAYWGDAKFSPEVLRAYNAALDEIKRRYDIEGFNLIGYDGGAAIAALLAAERGDVLSLRTAAGQLDTKALAAYQARPAPAHSLNPLDVAPKLTHLPQMHYIGGQDRVVPPSVLHSYLQEAGPSNCIQYELVQEAEHEKGWVDKWPQLLARLPACAGPAPDIEILTTLPEPDPLPAPVIRDKPEKP